ncbi:MAG: hypothetical protein AAFX87_01060 [Bacteroidota bacterium]
MKRKPWKIALIMLSLSLLIVVSCDDDDNNNAGNAIFLRVTGDAQVSAARGSDVTFSLSIGSQAGITSLTANGDNVNFTSGTTNEEVNYTFTVPGDAADGDEFDFEFVATDANSQTTEAEATVVVIRAMITLENKSITPSFLSRQTGFEDVQIFSLFSSEDDFPGSPDYVFGGSADGAGLRFDETTNEYVYIVNNEDNWAVSRIYLDETLTPLRGEYVMNSAGAGTRQCSATLATPEEHGFGPIFLTAGESGDESLTKAIPLFDPITNAGVLDFYSKPALGRWTAENAVPLPLDAYGDQTLVVMADDDSGPEGGQIALYMSDVIGDLENGSLYALRRTNENSDERDMVVGEVYDIEFVEIENANTNTGLQNNMIAQSKNAMEFGRVEDVDYRKGGGAASREVWFNVTGQNNSGNNADFTRTRKGRVYRMTLDENNPLEGTLEVIFDGDDANGPANMFQNPDNILVTDNYVYIQEDPNRYGDETHDAYLYQYNIATGALEVVFEIDQRSETIVPAYASASDALGSWEYGAMIDVSDIVGMDDTFLLCIQSHTWRDDAFAGVDGGGQRDSEDEGSAVFVIKGLPR